MALDLLSELIFLPAIVGLALTAVPSRLSRVIFGLGILGAAFAFGLSLQLFALFDPTVVGYQFEQRLAWIPSFGVMYYVGIDGIALVLLVLTTLLSLIALISSYGAIREKRKEFVIVLLFLESAMLGTFSSLDLFLFYVFWEAMLVPMYLLIGVFGGPRRIYATLKFFLYTMAGSVLMLVAILVLYTQASESTGTVSTALPDLLHVRMPFELQLALFLAFVVAFAIKIPLFPLHTWLPDAHVEAPTAGSVLLAGVLLKMGGYGLVRFAIPLFPEAARAAAPWIGALAVIGIVYGAYVALAQEDMKKLVAYSSVSHMGFVALGMASLTRIGMAGAVFQMVSHGLATGALFLMVGMLYERRHSRMLVDFGGLARVTPRLGFAFFVITLASIGLPGLSGFIGEFLVLNGAFQSVVWARPWLFVGFAVVGVVLGAGYMLLLYERLFLGEITFEENRKLKDLSWVEGAALALPVVLVVWLGLQPGLILSRVNPAVETILLRMNSSAESP